MVIEPVHFEKWAIFCIEKDYENGKYVQEKFYNISEQQRLGIYVEYGDVVPLKNYCQVEDFNLAIEDYFGNYIDPNGGKGGKYKGKAQQAPTTPEKKTMYFFLVIIPDGARQELFYSSIKNKINADAPVIS